MQAENEIALRKLLLTLAESLAYDSFYGVSCNGSSGEAFGDNQAEPGLGISFRLFARRRYNKQRPSGNTSAL